MSVSVGRGGEVNLSCTYPLEQTSVNISWTGPIETSHLVSIITPLNESTKSTLSVIAINGSLAGDYYCTAQFGDARVTSAAANLTVNCKCMYLHTIITDMYINVTCDCNVYYHYRCHS